MAQRRIARTAGLASLFLFAAGFAGAGAATAPDAPPAKNAASTTTAGTAEAIFPGEPGVRPFWTKFAARFIYAPAFDLPPVTGAASYRFSVKGADGQTRQFSADHPYAPLSPVWEATPEGVTELTVEGLDAGGKVVGRSGERAFYRSPGFGGEAGPPLKPYAEAGRWALQAIFRAPHVQHWLRDPRPDRGYDLYCYPPKVIGGLMRAMAAYSRAAESPQDREQALLIGRRAADYLIDISLPATSPFPHWPPTYSKDVDKPISAAIKRTGKWVFVPAAVDAALGYLDIYDLTHDAKYLNAAKAVAETYRATQKEDGTWAVMADFKTGEPLYPNRQTPTWIISLLDRLDTQYGVADFRVAREKAWAYILANPVKTYRWEGQFEDGTPREPYKNLAREQACDVAVMMLNQAKQHPEYVGQAEDMLRFSEDQFVIWGPVKDAAGWTKVMPNRRKNAERWITPCTMEQYGAYAPVARSSAIVLQSYLKAFEVTGKDIYRQKALALANGLIAGQAWLAEKHDGNGEIPTWLTGNEPHNWLNNSFYAAQGVSAVAALGDARK